jgi:thiamine kinase-like enzyme
MDKLSPSTTPHVVKSIDEQIKVYLLNLPPSLFGIQQMEPIEVLDMFAGAYNLNYHVRIGDKNINFRINIEQQSGLSDQIKYEFMALRYLDGQEIAPKAYYLDDSKQFFNFDILIEEYLEGPFLNFSKEEILEIAAVLAKLHKLDPPKSSSWLSWDDPLAFNYQQVMEDLTSYEAKITPDRKLAHLSKQMLKKWAPLQEKYGKLFYADKLNHTDVVRDNFIRSSKGLRMIDWEKPRLDDSSYDICCFLSEPAQLWCSHISDKVYSPQEREQFIRTYVELSGVDASLLAKKIQIRQPIVSLHWILWGAGKLCDLRDGLTVPELVPIHETKRYRYERISNPFLVEKLLESY